MGVLFPLLKKKSYMWVPIVIWQTNLTFSFPSWRITSGPIGRSMTRILQLQRSICITPEQWTGEGVSFIYGVWKRGRSRIDCYLKKWSGMDLITHWRLHWRFWLALLCVFCVSLFMYSCFYLYDTDIAIDLSLGPANRIVKYVFSLSRNGDSTKCRICGCTKWSMPLGFPFSSALSGFTDVLWHEKLCTCTLRRPCLRHSSILSPGGC